MRLVRYGEPGREKPALLHDGALRDIGHLVPDLAGDHLGPASLARIRAADPASLPAVEGSPRTAPAWRGRATSSRSG